MTSNTPVTQAPFPVTQAGRDAAANAVIQATDQTMQIRLGEADHLAVVQAFAALTPSALSGDNSQSSSNAGGVEPWPGCYADLQQRRVTTLAKLGLMLSVMASGEAAEVVGYDAADLYAEVLMALGIEDADDTDIALEIARDHPEGDILASLSTPTAEPMAELQRLGQEYDGEVLVMAPREPTDDMVQAGLYQLSVGGDEWAMVYQIWVDMFTAITMDGGITTSLPAKPVELAERILWHVEQVCGPLSIETTENPGDDDRSILLHNIRAALTTPPTPDRIGKDAVREALATARNYVVGNHDEGCELDLEYGEQNFDDEDGERTWPDDRKCTCGTDEMLATIDRALSATPAQEGDEAFCATVWDALKGDHTDLRRQQIILTAHRIATGREGEV
jgi:hypothetical protein